MGEEELDLRMANFVQRPEHGHVPVARRLREPYHAGLHRCRPVLDAYDTPIVELQQVLPAGIRFGVKLRARHRCLERIGRDVLFSLDFDVLPIGHLKGFVESLPLCHGDVIRITHLFREQFVRGDVARCPVRRPR